MKHQRICDFQTFVVPECKWSGLPEKVMNCPYPKGRPAVAALHGVGPAHRCSKLFRGQPYQSCSELLLTKSVFNTFVALGKVLTPPYI